MKFAENSSKTRISAAAYKPGFGYLGQQWSLLKKEFYQTSEPRRVFWQILQKKIAPQMREKKQFIEIFSLISPPF